MLKRLGEKRDEEDEENLNVKIARTSREGICSVERKDDGGEGIEHCVETAVQTDLGDHGGSDIFEDFPENENDRKNHKIPQTVNIQHTPPIIKSPMQPSRIHPQQSKPILPECTESQAIGQPLVPSQIPHQLKILTPTSSISSLHSSHAATLSPNNIIFTQHSQQTMNETVKAFPFSFPINEDLISSLDKVLNLLKINNIIDMNILIFLFPILHFCYMNLILNTVIITLTNN